MKNFPIPIIAREAGPLDAMVKAGIVDKVSATATILAVLP
jgi:hypothetical protein